MWQQDWALLGIEPTTELGAIKKAYALKLKVTRPDDDAKAYQALREAYERAQQWVKWQGPQLQAPLAADTPTASPAPDAADAPSTSAAPIAAAGASGVELPPPVEAHELIESLELAWRRGGEAALLATWAGVQQSLNEQALSQQSTLSAEFANWVLKLPQLPDAFIGALNAHFGWLNDFRQDQALGPGTTYALHAALADRIPPPPAGPELRRHAEPLLALLKLQAQGQGWWAIWWSTVIGPTLKRLRNSLSPVALRRLGLAQEAQYDLSAALNWAIGLRIAVMLLGVAGAALLLGLGPKASFLVVFRWGVLALLWVFAGMVLGAALYLQIGAPAQDARLQRRVQAWRSRPGMNWLGLGLLALATLYAAFEPVARMSAHSGAAYSAVLSTLADYAFVVVTALCGLVLTWPADERRAWTAGGLSLFIAALFYAAFREVLTTPACMTLGLTWLALGATAYEARVNIPTAARWLLRPTLNCLALADRWSYAFAMVPVLVVGAVLCLPDVGLSPWRALLIWILGTHALAWLQLRAESWGLARLGRAVNPC